jgi:hypothetical protein
MSRIIRLVAAVLILSSLSLGALNALPLSRSQTPVNDGVGRLIALADWVTSLLPLGKPHSKAPSHSRSKVMMSVDPNGGH